MKLLVLIAAIIAVVCSEDFSAEEEKKYHHDMATKFKQHLDPLNIRLALEANYYSKGHFIISAHSMWYKLGSWAGNFDGREQKEVFSLLNLPDEPSLRSNFYSCAVFLEGYGEDISLPRANAIAVDETVEIKKDWIVYKDLPRFMPNYLPSVTFEKPFGHVQKYVASYQSNIPHSSHTVLLDHLMFEGKWSPAFSERAVQQGQFYNERGESIATLEYLIMKGRVRVAHYPDKNVKVVEVPVGSDGIRTMLLAVGDKTETMIKTVFSGDISSDLKLSEEPIEVAVPRLSMSSGMDMATIFKNMKSSKVFSDPATSSSSTDTPAVPAGYFQFVTANITDSAGRDKSSNHKDLSNEETDLAALDKDAFIVNRPFLFALLVPLPSTDIKVPVFTGVYSYPGERGQRKVFD